MSLVFKPPPRWVKFIITNKQSIHYFRKKPRRKNGGFMDHNGKPYIGIGVMCETTDQYIKRNKPQPRLKL